MSLLAKVQRIYYCNAKILRGRVVCESDPRNGGQPNAYIESNSIHVGPSFLGPGREIGNSEHCAKSSEKE